MEGTLGYVKNTRKTPFFDNETPPVACDLGFHDDNHCHKNHHLNTLPLTFLGLLLHIVNLMLCFHEKETMKILRFTFMAYITKEKFSQAIELL
jgi:hypothetical protein